MAYRLEKQHDGLWTLRDLSIFAACERGGEKYGTDFLLDDVEDSNAEQRNTGYMAPVFVRHSDAKTGRHENENAVARMGNRRVCKVKVGKTVKPGMVVDLFNLSDDTKRRIVSGRLSDRSVEIKKRDGKPRIAGLALLGSTTPYHKLKAGSEFDDLVNFSEGDDATTVTTRFGYGEDMIENQPALEGDLHGALAEIMKVLHEIKDSMSETKEAKPEEDDADDKDEPEADEEVKVEVEEDEAYAASAEAPVQLSETSVDVAEFAELHAERVRLEAQLAALKAQSQGTEEKSQADLFLEHLAGEGFSIDVERETKVISKIGLDAWKSFVQPHLGRAPIEGSPTAFSTAPAPDIFSSDEDLKGYATFSEPQRNRALRAAEEWDVNADQGYSLTSAGRKKYIDYAVARGSDTED